MAIKKPELSFIIVNYKNQHLIVECVKAIVEKEVELDYEIIVIDNNSKDNSEGKIKEVWPDLRWFQMGYNSGFGRANNKGIKEAKGRYVLIYNSDVIIKSNNTINDTLTHLKNLPNSEKIILGTRLVNHDDSYQVTLRFNFPGIAREIRANSLYILLFDRFFTDKHNEKENQYEAHYKSGKVEWINGAFLLIQRKSIINNKLFFDDDFFLYGEDMEWAWRANKSGFNFYHWHERELMHIGSASMPTNFLKRCQVIVSDWMFIKKTRGEIYLGLLLSLVFLNLFIDSALFSLAKIRKRTFAPNELKEHCFRSTYYYLIKHYGLKILFRKTLSSKDKFYTNCYEDSFLKKNSK